jgi:hypothetical protein
MSHEKASEVLEDGTYLEFPLQVFLLSEARDLGVAASCGIFCAGCREVALIFCVQFEELGVGCAKHIIRI